MSEIITMSQIDETRAVIAGRTTYHPRIAIILGSGLGALAEAVEAPTIIPYGELPHWPVSTVVGHQGRLVIGRLEGQEVAVMQGRAHYYE